ncbi:FAD-dependent oxidoreductase [Streptomyces sp. NPDC006516]|uniref:FAD-dependent oxidoreductase n=1 Tax=Streptomyces sp. NPDC006516 TaxID=3154309 RepID=UPI0033A84EE4
MKNVVVMGAGPIGLMAAVMLARDGHRVTVLERDEAPPPTGDREEVWQRWHRPGVNQFRHPHLLLPAVLRTLTAEMPDAVTELAALGGVHTNLLDGARRLGEIGRWRPGDDRFAMMTARRPLLEAALDSAARRTERLQVRRGTAVTALLPGTERVARRPHVTGVLTASGEAVHGDLVIDAGGRNSPAGRMLRNLGAPGPFEERAEDGFLAYTRYFRTTDGSLPELPPAPSAHYPSVSSIASLGDAGTWSLSVGISSRDRALRKLSRPDAWHRTVKLLPDVAHWAEHGEPITEILAMSGMETRHRRFVTESTPVATGILSIGDAWGTTNPLFGLGLSMGAVHAALLRDLLRTAATDDPEELALSFAETTESTLGPVQRALADWDRHRLAEIEAATGTPPSTYDTDDRTWHFKRALDTAKFKDPHLLRLYAAGASLLAEPGTQLPDAELARRIAHHRTGPPYGEPGPTRDELLAAVSA